jgi:hypothetical protein
LAAFLFPIVSSFLDMFPSFGTSHISSRWLDYSWTGFPVAISDAAYFVMELQLRSLYIQKFLLLRIMKLGLLETENMPGPLFWLMFYPQPWRYKWLILDSLTTVSDRDKQFTTCSSNSYYLVKSELINTIRNKFIWNSFFIRNTKFSNTQIYIGNGRTDHCHSMVWTRILPVRRRVSSLFSCDN